jgi:hypothetical protein
MNTQAIKKIFEVRVERLLDEDSDMSWLGEYTDELKDGVIVRQFDEFYEKLPRDEEEDFIEPLPDRGREFRAFRPYAGGEKVGTDEYYKYGMQDYERMESFERQEWYFIGILAKARVGVSFDGGKTFNLDTFTSGGLWGIESDSDESYIKEEENTQLDELKVILEAYRFSVTEIDKAIKDYVLLSQD